MTAYSRIITSFELVSVKLTSHIHIRSFQYVLKLFFWIQPVYLTARMDTECKLYEYKTAYIDNVLYDQQASPSS